MLSFLIILVLSIPRYLVIDSKGIGTEFLEKQGAKVIQQVDSVTYLVEGNLEQMDYTPYEIALYEPALKTAKVLFNKGKYYIPELPEISYYFSLINQDSVYATLYRLQDFRTRYAYSDSCRRSEQYLVGKLQDYCDLGYLWPFQHNTYTMNNAVGQINGAKSDFILITSHLDSYSPDPWNNAPGADDNGSGTAAVIECARILQNIPNPMLSIQFVPFSAEELGLIGSYRYAEYVASNNLPLLGVLNFDMVGYNPQDGLDFDVNLDTLSLFGQVVRFIIENYVQGNNRYSYSPFSGSDHYPFAMRGYPWVFLIEANYQYNPNYHRVTDLVSTLDPVQMMNSVKLAVATASYFAHLPLPPESLIVANYGDGSEVFLTWPAVSYPGTVSFEIYRGISPTSLEYVHETSDTFAIVGGHVEGSTYYYTVRTKYSGRTGFGSPVKSIRVDVLPEPPNAISLSPLSNSISLYWRPNSELDLAGYYVYRSTGSSFVRLNSVPISDTFYVDASASQPIWYNYYVTAVDLADNESAPSDTVCGRPVTLSEGILVIDEFRDGTGTPFSPNAEMQRAFVDSVLSAAGIDSFNVLDISQVSSVSLSDIGVYSLIWVMSDDASELLGSRYRSSLLDYMHFGGKILFEGFKNALNLGVVSSYPAVIVSNPFNLPMDSVFLNTQIDFRGATSNLGFEMEPDASKLLPSWNGKLSNVEAYHIFGGQPLFYFDSQSDNSTFEGRVCGFSSGDSVIFLGFPLYYMRTQDVISFMNWLCETGFIGIKEKPSRKSLDLITEGNYIELLGVERAQVIIYSISGRAVKRGEYISGRFSIQDLKPGIYIYEIKAGNSIYKGRIIKVR